MPQTISATDVDRRGASVVALRAIAVGVIPIVVNAHWIAQPSNAAGAAMVLLTYLSAIYQHGLHHGAKRRVAVGTRKGCSPAPELNGRNQRQAARMCGSQYILLDSSEI